MDSQEEIQHFHMSNQPGVEAEIIILETEPGVHKVEENWHETLDGSREFQQSRKTYTSTLDDFLGPSVKKSAKPGAAAKSSKDLDAFFQQPRGTKGLYARKPPVAKGGKFASEAKSEPSGNATKDDVPRETSVVGSTRPIVITRNEVRGPKVVVAVKPSSALLSSKEEELIKDCVESLADQECLSKLRLKERINPLCMTEWKKIAETIVLLMKNHLPPNGFETIEYSHLREARTQMRDAYSWAGYVTGEDCHPNDNISSIAQDTCYHWMRKKKNWANQKKSNATKRTGARLSNPKEKKLRTANSYGVIPCQLSDISSIEEEKLLMFIAFSRELDEIDAGEVTQEQVNKAKGFFDCMMAVLKSAKPDKMEELKYSGNLAILRHFRIYYDYVLLITNRQSSLHKTFQEKCHTYLACLKDILKFFPPADSSSIINLDVANKPYMSLAKIIASQLHRRASFIIDGPCENENAIEDAGLVCIVEEEPDIYGLWVNGTNLVQGMTELQALFAFASIEDVLGFNQMQTSDSCEVIDFLRKYFLTLPDFNVKRKLLSQLGQAFNTFATIETEKNGGQLSLAKADCCKTAQEALVLLAFNVSTS